MANSSGGTNEHIVVALAEWKQGDFALSVDGFVHVDLPTLDSDGPFDPVLETVHGLVVVSQTCDIVNYTPDRSFVTVCPLVEVDDKSLPNIASGRTPNHVPLKNAPRATLVADLSRMMTVSKELLVTWERHRGFDTDAERQKFAFALERKHGRFAYPDAFVRALDKFRGRVLAKHAKDSEPGRIYRSIREIRVRAAPHWEAETVEIALVVILEDAGEQEISVSAIKGEIAAQVEMVRLPERYRFAEPAWIMGTRDDLLARDVTDSFPLDFNFLSLRGNAP